MKELKNRKQRINKEEVKEAVISVGKNIQEYKEKNDLRFIIKERNFYEDKIILKPISKNVMDMILDVAFAFDEFNSIKIDNKNKCFWFKKPFDEVEYNVQEYLFHLNDMDWLKFEIHTNKLS